MEREIPAKKECLDHPLQPKNNNENKVPNTKKKCPARSRSMGPTTSQQAGEIKMAENERRCMRRQSVRLKPNRESQVELFGIDITNFPMSQSTDKPLRKPHSDVQTDKERPQGSLKASPTTKIITWKDAS